MDAVTGDTSWSEASMEEAIPEFKRFNIIESDIRNVIWKGKEEGVRMTEKDK